METLESRGAIVSFNDPYVPVIREGRSNKAVAQRLSKPISSDYDVILLCTNHKAYETVDFKELGIPLVDCRNASSVRPEEYYAA